MKTDVHPKVEREIRDCIGRIQGKFLWNEQEAIDAIRAVVSRPAPKKIKDVGAR